MQRHLGLPGQSTLSISHADTLRLQGEMRYEVKWKGYEKKSDRTWETEGNLE